MQGYCFFVDVFGSQDVGYLLVGDDLWIEVVGFFVYVEVWFVVVIECKVIVDGVNVNSGI